MNDQIVDSIKLRKRMIDVGISNITELARRSGVSKPTIYDFLEGKSPYLPTYLKLCKVLGVDPEELLQNKEIHDEKNKPCN